MQALAELLRPSSLGKVFGQQHLVGADGPIAKMVQTQKLTSLILWGPPGVGKTTLANILLSQIDCHALRLSAVFSGVKEIKEALEQAEANQRGLFPKPTVLFVDEIHRFNKAQQDAFLAHIENGSLILIGATTENPSFALNNALLSRMQVYILESLKRDELQQLLKEALTQSNNLILTADAEHLLLDLCDGDARRLLNLLELVISCASGPLIDLALLNTILPKNLQRFDKGGVEFYNQISALHKSIRGSNPDAALYWFGRMLKGGADPLYLGRRLLRMAWEDIGLADINAATMVNNALQTYERLGSPEGELALAGAVIYLAVTNKSDSVELAFNKLSEFLEKTPSAPVPVHLRNAPTKLMAELGYGREYRHAHDFPHHYVANEQYFPDGMSSQSFYTPSNEGLEQRVTERLKFLKQLDMDAAKTHR